jgi:hypothetical protein
MKIDTALYNNEKRHQQWCYFIVDTILSLSHLCLLVGAYAPWSTVVQSAIHPIVGPALSERKSSGHQEECDMTRARTPCLVAERRKDFIPRSVRTSVRILRTSDALDFRCATQPFRRSVKHEAGEIDQSHSQAQFPFEQRVWYYRLRPAQRTQRRLPDQLWTSIARRPYLLFFPTLPPSETCLRPWGQVICFEKTCRCRNDLVLSLLFVFGGL